jgi:hypothetical protein
MTSAFNPTPQLTPAHRDLLRVLQAAVNGYPLDDPPADWATVLDLASVHQIADYLYPRVLAWDPACQPPDPLRARWRRSFLNAVARYTRVAIQTRELLTALHAAKVPVIPLKGAWLAERIYEDGACRPMSDIDLLVPPESLAAARAAIERLGYTPTDLDLDESRDKHVRYQRPTGPLPIELHWRLWCPDTKNNDKTEPAQTWLGLQEERLHGVPVQVFPPERLLVHLAQHILKHALIVPLKTYLDLVLLCRHYAPLLDPTRLDEEARAWRVVFEAKCMLQVAHDIWGVRPPAQLIPFLPCSAEHEKARSAAVGAALQLNCENRKISPALAAFCQTSGLGRLRIGLERMLLPPVEIRLKYPRAVRRWGLVGGYIGRCADLIRLHGWMLRQVARDRKAVGSDLSDFATRQALIAMIYTQERKP